MLVDSLKAGQPLGPVIEFRNEHQDLMDVQFRRPSGRMSRASVYAGLTRVLDVDVKVVNDAAPLFRYFIEHETHRKAAPDWRDWAIWGPLEGMQELWPAVERYLQERERWILTDPKAAHHAKEGRVHASMCRTGVRTYRVVNREASPSFVDTKAKDEICGQIRSEIRRVLDEVAQPKAWLKYRKFGTSPDILAVDGEGRLIVAEAKPASYGSGIVKGPIQARFYAGLIARWLAADPDASTVLKRMLEQRVAVGLARRPVPRFGADMPVVPVLAIGHGQVWPRAREHALELRDALTGLAPSEAGATTGTEIWCLGPDGNVEKVV